MDYTESAFEPGLTLLSGRKERLLLEGTIASLGEDLDILEAGCGRQCSLHLPRSARLVGIDPDANALKARVQRQRDLADYQVNTLHDAEFPDRSFDVIYCAFVLEHIARVDLVLNKFSRWVRPNGVIILRIPDSRSAYGFIARYTPHWFHVAVYRYLFGHRNAGRAGFGPYPVVYDRAMSIDALREYAVSRGYGMTVTANSHYLERWPWLKPVVIALSVMSLGWLQWRHANLAIVFRT